MSLNEHLYALEKFGDAVNRMATSRDSLQGRLLDAYTYTFITITAEDLPESLQPDFESLVHDLTRRPAVASEGTAAATINAMSDDEARRMIGRVVTMLEEIAGHVGPTPG
jgi:hypothetical protein